MLKKVVFKPKRSHKKLFSQWQQNTLILIIIMPDYNYSIFTQLDNFGQNSRDILIVVMTLKYSSVL